MTWRVPATLASKYVMDSNKPNENGGRQYEGQRSYPKKPLYGIARAGGFGKPCRPVCMDQQPVVVNAIRGAGHQCTEVLPWLDRKRLNLVREHDLRGIDLISIRDAKGMDNKHVPLVETTNVVEHSLRVCAGMRGEYSMG